MKRLLIRLIKFYQSNISPGKGPCCRFIPTCSNYAIEALETHGVMKGSLLTLFRLLRCNRLFRGGYDPVPPKRDSRRG